MLQMLSSLLPMYTIICLGFIAQRMNILHAATAPGMSRFIYWFSLPALLFKQFSNMEDVPAFSGMTALGLVLSTLASYVLAFVYFARIKKFEQRESAVLTLLSTCPNTAYLGLPIIMMLQPDNREALMVAGFGALLTILTLLIADIQLKLGTARRAASGPVASYILRSLLGNPLFMASAAGVVLGVFSIPTPAPIKTAVNMLASTATPCALFCVGAFLASYGASRKEPAKDWRQVQPPVMIIKLIVQPVLVFGTLILFGVDAARLGVALLVMSMPTALSCCIIASKYNVMVDETSLGTMLTTSLAIVVVPFFIMLLQLNGFF